MTEGNKKSVLEMHIPTFNKAAKVIYKRPVLASGVTVTAAFTLVSFYHPMFLILAAGTAICTFEAERLTPHE